MLLMLGSRARKVGGPWSRGGLIILVDHYQMLSVQKRNAWQKFNPILSFVFIFFSLERKILLQAIPAKYSASFSCDGSESFFFSCTCKAGLKKGGWLNPPQPLWLLEEGSRLSEIWQALTQITDLQSRPS